MNGLEALNLLAVEMLGLVARQSLYVVPIFVVVAIASWVLRRRGPGLQFALWLLVLLRLILPPDLSHPVSAARLLSGLTSKAVEVAVDVHPAGLEAGFIPIAFSDGDATSDRSQMPWALFGLATWVIGALFVGCRMWVGRAKYQRTARQARNFCRLADTTQRWRQRFRVRRQVRIAVTTEPLSPFTVGILRPTIILPDVLLLRRRACDAAIAHEMAHISRFDAFWTDVQRFLHSLFFFHPLIWYAGSRIDLERERLCDAAVLASGDIDQRVYAGALVDVAGLGLNIGAAPAFTQPKRRVHMRVHSILLHHTPSISSRCVAAGFVLLLGVVFLPLAGEAGNAAPPLDSAVAPSVHPVAPIGPAAAPPPPAAPTVAVESAPRAPAPPSAPTTMAAPVPEARLTQGWGDFRNPFSGEEVFHRGFDLAAPQGTEVHAGADGVVSRVLVDYDGRDTGRFVIIDHGNGLTSYYGHLDEVLVATGDSVDRGETIATVGMTGLTTGPHIHFEVRRNGERVDPGLYIER